MKGDTQQQQQQQLAADDASQNPGYVLDVSATL